MSGFLTFLSNNYLYFLIAAGVLAFALVGFLIDIKKKKEEEFSNNIVNEANIPNVGMQNNVTPTPTADVYPQDTNAVDLTGGESYNPAPPMPEQPVDVQVNNPVNAVPNEYTNTAVNTTPENLQPNPMDNNGVN